MAAEQTDWTKQERGSSVIDARADIFNFNYIEMIYNPKRRHGTAGGVSPVEFEKRYFQWHESV